MSKTIFVDTSRCTACRGCQIACKEWHELPANETRQTGTHQNPPDLNPYNHKVVRFSEHLDRDTVRWYFFPDQCRHCEEPPCKMEADDHVKDAIVRDSKTGAVIFTPKTKKLSAAAFKKVKEFCPYNVPQRNIDSGLMVKCDMCNGRVSRGMPPACVKVCSTGAMNFGERADMLVLAKKRLQEVKAKFPKARLVDPDSVSVVYLLMDEPKKYHQYAAAAPREPMDRQRFLAWLFSPLKKSAEALYRG